jgi:hypothetical protein
MSDVAVKLLEQSKARLDRVRGLVGLHDWLSSTPSGQPPVPEDDVLRAAVVFLHATLENFLRSLAMERLPDSTREVWNNIPPISSEGRKLTLTLGDLHAYRARSVADFVLDSIIQYLDLASFNNPGEIQTLLKKIDVDIAPLDRYRARLGVMMARRHLIAHRFDQDPSADPDSHTPTAIDGVDVVDVVEWIDAAESFIM